MTKIKFVGIDSWNRPIWKDKFNNFYGSTEHLFHYLATEKQIRELVQISDILFFGNEFDCEPIGDPVKNIEFGE